MSLGHTRPNMYESVKSSRSQYFCFDVQYEHVHAQIHKYGKYILHLGHSSTCMCMGVAHSHSCSLNHGLFYFDPALTRTPSLTPTASCSLSSASDPGRKVSIKIPTLCDQRKCPNQDPGARLHAQPSAPPNPVPLVYPKQHTQFRPSLRLMIVWGQCLEGA